MGYNEALVVPRTIETNANGTWNISGWCCYCDYCHLGECLGAAYTICLTPAHMYISYCINHIREAEESLLIYLLSHPRETVESCE